MSKKEIRSAFFVLMASLLFSIGGLCMKLIPWSALAINGARNLLGAAVIGIFLLVTRHRLRLNRPVLIGALSVMGVTTLFTIANKLTTAANAIVLQFTAPVFVIILMLVLFHVRPTKLDIATCVLVLLGVVLFFVDSLQAGNMTGNAVALLAGVCYAGVFMMNAAEESDPLSSTFLGQLACGVIFTPFCAGEPPLEPVALTALLALGILQVGAAYILLSLGIQHTSPVMASLITGLEPVLNPLWVALFCNEMISPLALAGAVLVVGAIVGYNVIKARRPAAEPDQERK